MDQVISTAISAHPVAISKPEKAPALSSPGCAKPSRLRKYRSCQRLCCTTQRTIGALFMKNRNCPVHALPLQALTTDNDSDGSPSSGPSPSSSSVEYAGIYQADDGGGRQSLLYYIRVWYTHAKTQNVSVTIQQVLERSKTELQTVDKGQILRQIKSSQVVMFGVHWWESTQPWIKWPISIFIPWFLLVSMFYGPSASLDLLPLWIFGPICAGIMIKAGMELSAGCRQWLADKKLKEGLMSLTMGLKTGRLPRQLIDTGRSRFEAVRLQGMKAKSDLEAFIQSGEYKEFLRQYADRKLLELQEVCIDKYEDWRLTYLYLERKLKNII